MPVHWCPTHWAASGPTAVAMCPKRSCMPWSNLPSSTRFSAGSRVSAATRLLLAPVCRPAVAALFRGAADRGGGRGANFPQARRPQPHRRPQDQQLHRPGPSHPAHGQAAESSPKPAPVSMAWPPPRRRRCLAWNARFTWARKTCAGKSSTSSRCSALGTEVISVKTRQPHAARRHQRCHARLDGQRGARRITSSAASSGRIRFRHGARFSGGHRVRRRGSSAWHKWAACRKSSSLAWAEAATRRACFIPLWLTIVLSLSASRPADAASEQGEHAATLELGYPGVLHGAFSYVLQDEDGQTAPVHSVSAGLDYPGVGPEHSYWKDTGRIRLHQRHATQKHWRRLGSAAGWRGFCRPWRRPMPLSRGCGSRRHAAARTKWWSSVSRGAATRIVSRWPGLQGEEIEMNAIDALFQRLRPRVARPSCLLSPRAIQMWRRAPGLSARWSSAAPSGRDRVSL